ncbi:spore germination protein [Ammoniphilus resinae]|uniref:Spore germination protein KA n=1 Tax=Ammoniphilus resinae TaxID=861532 RepID=A0ABS4GPF1_9BACL|nr:spore germination protein [Ammoniphilus resinae]MBP1932101.1 spore germination protein KA [Ammoniphilus resinae]
MGLFTKIRKKLTGASSASAQNQNYLKPDPLHPTLQENIQKIKETLGNSTDLMIRKIQIGKNRKYRIGIFYIDGLVDNKTIQKDIMKSLLTEILGTEVEEKISRDPLPLLKESILSVGSLKDIGDYGTFFSSLLSGETVLLVDGCEQGLALSTVGGEQRAITEPVTQTVVRGPQNAFTENIHTNVSLVRRIIKDPNLWMETRTIGRVTQTKVSVMYLKGIADEKVVEEVRQRLDHIDIDGILESGYIEELIQDNTYSPFPTVYNSERPDVIASELLEGRIAILVDGTPFVLVVPAIFVQFFQSAEDYYQRADFGLIRILRYVALALALLGPSFYVAITTFHQEMLPTTLLISLAAQREGVPFPAFIEALIMETTFELLREAGVRMPRPVGQAVSIVGALVIGQAAVEAGLVSAAMVIVVSVTAIANFTFPSFNIGISIRLLRFGLMFIAASFGLFGITVGLIAIVLHLCSLKSFGVPYLSPMAPFILSDQKDAIIRLPRWALFTRSKTTHPRNLVRQQPPQKAKPKPPKGEGS